MSAGHAASERHAVEALRQQALVAAIFGAAASPGARLREHDERLRRGLSAYRANAQTIAERALAAAFPTTAALIGEEDFAALARALWLASPPWRGDLAHWGHELPAFIEAQRDFDPWPFLGDAARLDLALLRCEAASDATLERETLVLLAHAEPDALCLQLQPAVQLLASRWPIATIHAAHREPTDTGFAAMNSAIEAQQSEAVVVARSGWRAEVCALTPSTFAWMHSLAAGHTLDRALAAAQDAGPFDFDTWLVQALQQHWLWRAVVATAPPIEENPDDTDLA